MAKQTFSFPIYNSVVACVLDDDTMEVKIIALSISKNGVVKSHAGYSDGVINYSSDSNDRCAYVKDNNIEKIKGKVQTGGFDTPGEIWFDFENYDNTYIASGIAMDE